MEIPLDKVEEYLEDVIASTFKKERKVAFKLLQRIKSDVENAERSIEEVDAGINREKDDLVTRSAIRFVEAMKAEFKKFDLNLEGDINHEVLKETFDFLSKLFTNYNENGKKWIPKFGKDYKSEMKTLQVFMNKLFRNNGKLDSFIRRKYSDAREAEEISEDIDRLEELVERTSSDREKIDAMESELQDLEEKLERQEEKLVELENHDLITMEKKLFRQINTLKQKIQLEFSKLKKSMKKFLKALQRGEYSPRFGITESDVKAYFKDPFSHVIEEGATYPKLRSILENLVSCMHDEIEMKNDKREKSLETIKEIKEDRSLEPLVREYNETSEKRDELLEKIEKEGISTRIKEVKQEISDLTTQKGHLEADIAREKENVINTLKKMKLVKNSLENEIEALSGEELSILLAL
ncbi:hypothetical protein GF325_08975 [Candidatus Bathyarchaeota archaeon]|nr:hypothetical protein [Candidatus Bathyarchaeota archaeon]